MTINIKCWNIFGFSTTLNGFKYNKLHSPDFLEQVNNYQIFGLLETQHTANEIDQLQILNYKCYQVCRKKLKYGRKNGGIAVYVHNSICGGVKKLPTDGSQSILIK